MAIFNASSLSGQALIIMVAQRLVAHHDALLAINKLYIWLIGQADADLIAIGISAADLGKLRSAMADAQAEFLLHTTGSLPNTYTLPYTFMASQNIVAGPQ